MFKIFRKNKVEDQFDYEKFLNQIRLNSKRKHLLTDNEVNKYFIDKINRKKYHICFTYCIQVGEYIDKYNWDIMVFEKKFDKNGILTKEYYSSKNTPIVDSKYMNEYFLYKTLYELRGKDCG